MSIRMKALAFLAASICLMVAVFTVTADRILAESFTRLEQNILNRTQRRLANAMEQEKDDVCRIAGDWAPWDDTYLFAQRAHPEFVEENLTDAAIKNLRLQLLVFLDNSNRIVYATGFDSAANARTAPPKSIDDWIKNEPHMLEFERMESCISDYEILDDDLYIIASRAIMTSDMAGPRMGTLIFGRKVDSAMASGLTALIQNTVTIHPHGHIEDIPYAKQVGSNGIVIAKAREEVFIHLPLVDEWNETLATICVTVPRELLMEYRQSRRVLYLTLIFTGLFIGLGVMTILEWSVLRPIGRMIRNIIVIGVTPHSQQRLSVKGKGELSDLGNAIDQMLEAIDTGQSERLKALEALSMEKEQISTTLRSIGDGVITTDRDGSITLMNPVAENMTGCRMADAAGKPLNEVYNLVDGSGSLPQSVESALTAVLATGNVFKRSSPVTLVSSDGVQYEITDTMAPIRDQKSRVVGLVLVFRDMTDLRRAEEHRNRANKLESIGLLAGGIAHDFNNVLTTIMANISLARLPGTSGSDLAQYLDGATKSLGQARALTQQLLTFSSGGAPVRQTVSLGDLITETVKFASRGSNITCRFEIADDLRPANIDPDQISQVLNNLVINAVEAMPQGGEITVRAANAADAPPAPAHKSGQHFVRVDVIDHGHGISREHISRIFDPYFSTKKRGSGLGLATCFSIVNKHGGQILVDSEIGKGSRFTLFLPASLGQPPKRSPTAATLVRGHGHVLVMDDEPLILGTARQMLETAGYEVKCVPDGAEAVEAYRNGKAAKPFDIVILDLTVPGGMGGLEAFKQIKAMDPNARVIVSSGYSTDSVMANYRDYGFTEVLVKPYGIHGITSAVKRAMES